MTFNSCGNIKERFVDALYNELSEQEMEWFQSHLAQCPGCENEYSRLSATIKLIDKRRQPQVDESFWSGYWSRLNLKMDQRGIGSRRLPRLRELRFFAQFKSRWVLAPALSLILLVVGFFIGRSLNFEAEQRGIVSSDYTLVASQENNRSTQLYPAVAEHFDSLKPLLIDLSNRSVVAGADSAAEQVTIDKDLLKTLILQNYILKRLVAKSTDEPLKQLLEELEMVLVEFSNRNGGTVASGDMLKSLLDDNDVLMKIDLFEKNQQLKKI